MLAAMMLLAMVACGNNNSEPTPEPTPTPDETKTLYMATEGTFPPYEYYDGDKLVGIDVEVAVCKVLREAGAPLRYAFPCVRQTAIREMSVYPLKR